MPKISVCLSPALLHLYDLESSIVVVIDIFRATSSMCYGIANGAKAIIPVLEMAECLAYQDSGCLLAAERDGKIVAGFDFGNSPFSYTKEKVYGKTIVLTTTNGTKAIQLSKKARQVLIGSFLNLSALAQYLSSVPEDILLVCAGWKDDPNLEDTSFAGALTEKLQRTHQKEGDASHMAEQLYLANKNRLYSYLSQSDHGQRMLKLLLEKDIHFCLQEDIVADIPVLLGDSLVKL